MDATTLKARIDQALKEALLARDERTTLVLRGVKAAILNEEVAQQKRDVGLNDTEIQTILAREAKKRVESAEMYRQGNAPDKAEAELAEKDIIETFLPPKISDQQLQSVIDQTVSSNLDLPMGQIIGLVKKEVGTSADGALIAQLVKQRMGL